MSKNLLVVFGGTTQTGPQEVFSMSALSSRSTDSLQFNFATSSPNVRFNNRDWLIGEPSGFFRNISVDIKSDAPTQPPALKKGLDRIKDIMEDVNWSSKNYTENSDARGMTVEAWRNFSQAAGTVLQHFLEANRSTYQTVFVLAHSRGCAFSIAATEAIKDMGVVKRLVLLDPVGKNVGFSTTIIDSNVQSVQKLKSKMEVHIITKSESATYNYECYADQLVGIKPESHYADQRFSNLENVYVHAAKGLHEGMLGADLSNRFHAVKNIISASSWTQTCFQDGFVDMGKLKTSGSLQKYRQNASKAQDYDQVAGDQLTAYAKLIRRVDRRAAFTHCLAHRVAESGS
ncbi:MAG: hypothetical protein ACPG8W_16280 [Candidatus Promineifilaceae bacterium]